MNEIIGQLYVILFELEQVILDYSELKITATESQKAAMTEIKTKLHEVISGQL